MAGALLFVCPGWAGKDATGESGEEKKMKQSWTKNGEDGGKREREGGRKEGKGLNYYPVHA